jgi:hypothetical protein
MMHEDYSCNCRHQKTQTTMVNMRAHGPCGTLRRRRARLNARFAATCTRKQAQLGSNFGSDAPRCPGAWSNNAYREDNDSSRILCAAHATLTAVSHAECLRVFEGLKCKKV